MLTRFWEGLGNGLADRFLGTLFTPALLFWATGAAAWLFSSLGPGGGRQAVAALRAAAAVLEGLPTSVQFAVLVAAAFLLIASALAAEQLTLPLLRVLEGYGWPAWAAGWLRDRACRRRQQMMARWMQILKERKLAAVTAETAMELAGLEQRVRQVPASEQLIMPTRLGNVLRAAEERPSARYGLDVAVCWPMLWLLLDKDTRDEVANARSALNGAATLLLWAAVSVVWTPLAWWVLPVAVAVALAVYYVPLLSAAKVYGDLMDAAFDLRRMSLYEALRWPLPATPEEELAQGRALTEYLWRGTAPAGARFSPAPEANSPPSRPV